MPALRLLIATAVILLVAGQPLAAEHDWPSKPVKVIVPWPAGGIVDARARLLAARLSRAQIQLEHLPYKGGGPALQDVVAGHVPVMFDFAPTAFAHVRSGKLKPLVTACGHRIDLFPQVPSAAEAGYAQLELIGWGGIFAPRGTPATIVQRLNREINQIIVAPDVRSHVAMAGSSYPLWTPEEFAEFIRSDRPRWGEIARTAGIEPQ